MKRVKSVWKQILELGRQVSRLQLSLYGANACFFLVLSIFPALLLVLSSLRYTSLTATDLITMLEGIIPKALMGAAERLIVSTFYNSSGTVVSISALTALWSASRGIYGLLTGLNWVYGVRENRGYLYTRLISVVYLFAFLVVLMLTLILHVFGGSFIAYVERLNWPITSLLSQIVDLRMTLLVLVQILVFAVMYTALPNRRNRFFSSLPGAVAAALGWQGFSQLFSVYVDHLTGYSNIYGSVYAMALGMLWLYFCMMIVLFGGAVNCYFGGKRQENI